MITDFFACFSQQLGQKNKKVITTTHQVAKHVQPLVDLRAMFAADGADAYMLAYSSLLQACPGISPAILEKIIHARSDVGKAEIRQVWS